MQSGGCRVGIIECQLDKAYAVLLEGGGNVPEVVGKRHRSRMASQRTSRSTNKSYSNQPSWQ